LKRHFRLSCMEMKTFMNWKMLVLRLFVSKTFNKNQETHNYKEYTQISVPIVTLFSDHLRVHALHTFVIYNRWRSVHYFLPRFLCLKFTHVKKQLNVIWGLKPCRKKWTSSFFPSMLRSVPSCTVINML